MTTRFASLVLLVSLASLVSVPCRAENTGYWELEIPVPGSATNVDRTEDRLFMTKSASFDWEGEDTVVLREYYAQFFQSIGWEDPLADRPAFSGINTSGWGSFAMDFDQYNKPFARYGTHWRAREYPAAGVVALHLTSFEDGKLKGSVEVTVTPHIELEAGFRLLELLGNDPRNLFRLHDAVQGNPFEVHTIALPANYEDESDPLLSDYYQIVDEIIDEYRQWERDYVLD